MHTGEIVGSIFVTIAFFALIYVMGEKAPRPLNYRFTEEGIDFVVLGGRIRIFQIQKQNIRDVTVISGFRACLRAPYAFNVSNPFRKRVLLVRTTGPSYILTPKDPEGALRALGLDYNS